MEDLRRLIGDLGKTVDPIIEEILTSNISRRFRGLIKFQVAAGGKRLRPAFLLISCQLLGGRKKDALYPAAGIEILHNYTLIIDDIIDHSSLRRDEPTVWKKFGKSMAECIGAAYSASIFQAAQKSKNPQIVSEIYSKVIKTVVEGEVLDILFERGGREDEPYVSQNRYKTISKKDYMKMIDQKADSLFGASCKLGGISAQGTPAQISALEKYGRNLGIAFQIQDDILDIFGDQKKFGKKIGKDILERKGGNIVMLLALEELNKKDREKFLKILKRKRIFKKDIEKVIEFIKSTNGRKRSERIARIYVNEAKKSIKNLPDNKWKKVLYSIANFVIERDR